MPLDPTVWITLIATLCGGVGLKVVEHWLGKTQKKVDEASRLRDELRIEISSLREDINELEAERDKYRNDYYGLMEKYSKLYFDLQFALQQLKSQTQKALEQDPPKGLDSEDGPEV